MTTDSGFEEIYRTHYRRVFNLCRYLLNSVDRAEDAVHEVFLRAHARMASYDPALPMSSWLLKIAGNHCVDLLRRKATERRIFDEDSDREFDIPAAGSTPLGEVLAAERGEDVRRAMSAIPEKYRAPLVLAYYNELGYDEIAGILGVERTQVALLIFRGKQHLRQRMAKGQRKENAR
ncbi:MAG TPA: RNA polymerase sigma factor [Terriglobia bacterium]|nr:RNA polymerase sigma factor [Terriglobia bacterium]